MIHIATVHHGSRWVDVQLGYLRRHLSEPYTVWASVENVPAEDMAKFDHAMEMLAGHSGKLNLLWALVDEAADDEDIVVFCDSDTFPIADWVPLLRESLATHPLVAIERIEDDGDPQPHPAFCAATAGLWREIGLDWSGGYLWRAASGGLTTDVGSNLLFRLERAGVEWLRLHRQNTHDLHPVWFGVYGGAIYHHGAGSRRYPLTRPELVELAYHESAAQPLRFVLDVPVALRRKVRMWRNRRLSAEVYDEILTNSGFWRRFVDMPAALPAAVGTRIDALIVSHESADDLPGCIAALPPETRVSVIDNASRDASAAVARSLGASVVESGVNLGFAAAANRLAAAAEREYLLFLNPDARIRADKLAALEAELDADERTAVVGPLVVDADGTPRRSAWPFPSPVRTWLEALGGGIFLRRPRDFLIGACLLVRASAFAELGGFDERFWLYGEDADLCRRLGQAGWRVRLVPRAVAEHDGGASGVGDPGSSFEHFQRGAELYVLKHYGPTGLLVHRLGLLVGTALRIPFLAAWRTESARRKLRRRVAILSRLAHVLVTHPRHVPE